MTITLVSCLRDGIASQLPSTATPDAAGRVSIEAAATLSGQEAAAVQVRVLGPGDVSGLDPRQVIRMDPPPAAQRTEPNMFTLVELDRPDLPWLFTPGAPDAQQRLSPWLALVVVPMREGITLSTPPGGLLPVLEVDDTRELPPLDDSWAWAHAQVNHVGAGAAALTEAVRSRPGDTLARLICPRRLEPQTRYLACVVPAFEAGRTAGLGDEPSGGTAPAWSHPPEGGGAITARVPVLHSWEFHTGDAGDFETLVRRLKAIGPPAGVGRRQLDVSTPGPAALADPNAELAMSGALRPAGQLTPAWTNAAARQALATLVDAGAGLVVAPPLYGGRAVGRSTVPSGTNPRPLWLRELNLDPRHRGIAGLGARIVQENQEALMSAAWEQAGAIEEANRRLRAARMARRAGRAIVNGRLARVSSARLLQLGGPALDRLPVAADGTLARARLTGTRMPREVATPAFRRLMRPAGKLGASLGGPGAPGKVTDALDKGRAQPDRSATGRPGGLITTGGLLGALGAARSSVRAGGSPVTVDAIGLEPTAPGGRMPVVRATRESGGTRVEVSDRGRVVGGGSVSVDGVRLPARNALERMERAFQDPSTIDGLGGTFEVDLDGRLADLTEPARGGLIEALREPAADPPAAQPAAALDALRTELLDALDPRITLARAVLESVRLPEGVQGDDELDDVLAAPSFPAPLANELQRLAGDLILPGADGAPAESAFAVVTNPGFVQALLVGANEEMARELRWRDFPTDERGTCFVLFWDARGTVPEGTDPPPDIKAIHEFAPSGSLGDAVAGGRQQVVLVVRSELFRRYPGTQVLAVPGEAAQGGGRRPKFDAPELPRFRGKIGNDTFYFGFSFDDAQARGTGGGHGYYAVFQQPPGAPRFGLDEPEEGGSRTWPASPNDLTWDHVATTDTGYVDVEAAPVGFTSEPSVRWGETSAGQARVTFQQPMRVAMHFSDLLGTS